MEVFCSLRVFWYCGSFGLGVVGLFVSIVLIYSFQALIITGVMRFLDHSGFILYLVYSIMGHHTCSIFATPGM